MRTNQLKVSMDKRILNEFGSKILNEERVEAISTSRSERVSRDLLMLFNCECDDAKCESLISISSEEYEKAHSKTKYFIVLPGHVRADLEENIASFKDYVIVAKFFPRPAPVA
jgi:hypothetical protein